MRHGVRAEAAAAAKKRETLPVDTAMMNVFNGMVKKMRDGGGVSFDFDLTQGDNEEVLPTTLERRDNEDEDVENDE